MVFKRLSRQTFTWICSSCLHSKKKGKKKEVEVKFCFYTTVLHPTSVMTYEMYRNSDFLIGGSEEANQSHGPTKFIPLTTEFFVWRLKKKNLFYAEKIRDLRHMREIINVSEKAVTTDIFQRTRREIEYRLDQG